MSADRHRQTRDRLAYRAMTVDIALKVLQCVDSTRHFGQMICHEMRELVGARSAGLYLPQVGHAHPSWSLIEANPQRRRSLLEQVERWVCLDGIVKRSDLALLDVRQDGARAKARFQEHGVANCLPIPLLVQRRCEGVLVLLDVPQDRGFPLVLDCLHELRPTMATVLKIARMFEDQEGVIQARTRELAASKARFSGLLQRLNEMVYRMSLPDGRYEYVGPAAKDVFGYTAQAFVATPALIRDIVHPDFKDYFQSEWDKLIRGQVSPSYEYKIVDPAGQVRWIFQSNSGVFDDAGKIVAIEGCCIDITERKRAEEEIRRLNAELEERVRRRTADLEASNQELEAFAYSVSHDLRTPLRGIDGFGKILLEDYADKLDEGGVRAIRRIRAGTQRLGQLIDDILKLSRLSRTDITYQTVNLSVIAESVSRCLHEGQPHRLIEWALAPGIEVQGDQTLLSVVMENLLGNAFKFTAKHDRARIEFGMQTQDAERILFVRDDGAGFDMNYVDKLFGAFQRLHHSREFEGTGIGLATVQRIIRRHGGRIWAHGDIEGGATFYFTLAGTAPKMAP